MKKHWQYLKYIARHKWFVLIAGIKIGASPWRLLLHDWSKLMPCEWFPYVEYFYGKRIVLKPRSAGMATFTQDVADDRKRAAFDRAWLHHQKLNPHHWQYWILHEDSGSIQTLPMSDEYVLEMVADWMGAGRAITGKWDAQGWYEKNKLVMILHAYTRDRVEQLLNLPS